MVTEFTPFASLVGGLLIGLSAVLLMFLLGRIMEVLSPEEFGSVVNAIVDAVEQPDRRPLCKR